MSVSTVARRYARALFDVALEEKQVDKVGQELDAFVTGYEASSDFRDLGQTPSLSYAVRANIVAELGQRLGASQATIQTVSLLAQRQRLAALPELASFFHEMSDEQQGILRATVRCAVPPSAGYLDKLKKKIEDATAKTVVITFEEDASLIAGVVTQIGDRVVDGSVRGKLDQLRQSLTQA